MKTIFKSVSLVLVTFATLGLAPRSAEAQVFHDVRTLLSQHFATSDRVRYERLRPSVSQRTYLEHRLSRPLAREDYVVFVATTGDRIDGYAIVDVERGQHEMITFAVFFDAEARITRQEVIAYREPFGDGIRQGRFRRQFQGRSAASGFRLGEDIDAVSGATISAQSMCAGVQRAALLVEMLVRGEGELRLVRR